MWGTEFNLEAYTKICYDFLASDFSPIGGDLIFAQNILHQIEHKIHTYDGFQNGEYYLLKGEICGPPPNLNEFRSLVRSAEITRSLISPIRRLPPEILSEIFIWHRGNCDLEQSFDYNHPMATVAVNQTIKMYENTRTILQVCRQWRRISLGTPSLFTDIYLASWYKDPVSILQMHLERSGALPFSISFPYEFSFDSGPHHDRRVLMGPIFQNISRCKVLDIPDQICMDLLFALGGHGDIHVPQMRRLYLHAHGLACHYFSRDECGRFIAPQLNYMEYVGPTTDVVLYDPTRLTELQLQGMGLSEMSHLDMYEVLRAHPNLRSLYVDFVEMVFPFEDVPLPAIVLPELRNLQLDAVKTEGSMVAQSIQAPKLESVLLRAQCMEPESFESFRLYIGSHKAIRKFGLVGGCLSNSEAVSLLKSVPNVETLVFIRNFELSQQFAHEFATSQTEDGQFICPNITHIEFETIRFTSGAAAMLETRLILCPNLRITLLECTVKEGDEAEALLRVVNRYRSRFILDVSWRANDSGLRIIQADCDENIAVVEEAAKCLCETSQWYGESDTDMDSDSDSDSE